MAATALVAARVEPELKERAKKILEREGLTESQLIRRVFEYVVHMGEVPEFVFGGDYLVDTTTGETLKYGKLLDFASNGPLSKFNWESMEMDSLKETLNQRCEP